MNLYSQLFSLLVYSIHSWLSLGKMSKQLLYRCKYQCVLTFSIISLGTIRLKYKSFVTDMGIQMVYKERQQKKRNVIFAVLITDLIPIYAFRASPLT